ncbi:sigma-54-specific transcriptional regulator [Enterobacter sp. BIGb0383]|uniref:sigma-54 interaction domain-containing protein n=1 Tax=unclassified Enterobacter TaxID=2608935 RepID=UPI000F4780AF|nr:MULTISPECIES: sigma-54 dependent transcriptional regulator [unclassified Enterobacter]ROP58156.1 sigma-54-specific transcriptional regulator [Enterobacter sp. BIGb0383]ROS06956.1 sigma-54-specific transcriptional regulator [Enterobacter sp. BIGb0359]
MHRALAFALSLTTQEDEPGLNDWLLKTLDEHWQPRGVLLALSDVSGRQLECYGRVNGRAVSMTLEASDFGHPLAGVLHNNQARIWETLNGGARIEHAAFRALLQDIGPQNGLYALPVRDAQAKTLGILGLFADADRLELWRDEEDLMLLTRIYARQLARVQVMRHSQRERSALRDSLRQITGESRQRQQQASLLDMQLIGQSDAMRRLREHIGQIAGHYLSVLIQGETGTGKEVVARLVHQCSGRSERPFVAINCAAIPENLIESELFGYQKGAFSGAQNNKEGLVAQANGGTLFLDEVGDMPVVMQAKLLRVLETHSYRPLGGDKERHSDFRVIAATHQPLEQQVAEGRFRQDLYHRLCQSQMQLPPLRDRAEDISLLCGHFIAEFGAREGKHFGSLNRTLLAQLLNYRFPGNVRELRNVLEVACAQAGDGEEIGLQSLSEEVIERMQSGSINVGDDFCHIHDLRQALLDYEATVIAARLRHFDGNRHRAAESLNIPRRTLDHKCLKLEVQ